MQCRVCSEEFEPTKSKAKNKDWICLRCSREQAKAWRLKRKAEGRPVKSTKMPRDYHAAYEMQYNKSPEVRKRKSDLQKKYRNDPDLRMRHEARWQANRALKSGRIIKQSCHCGEKETEMHHADYYNPLDVVWLCRKCHAKLHAKAKGE